jgi:hypothetical protein
VSTEPERSTEDLALVAALDAELQAFAVRALVDRPVPSADRGRDLDLDVDGVAPAVRLLAARRLAVALPAGRGERSGADRADAAWSRLAIVP